MEMITTLRGDYAHAPRYLLFNEKRILKNQTAKMLAN